MCHVDVLLFSAAKQDILAMTRPFSKILQDNSLFLPSVISSSVKTIKSFDKLVKLLEKGESAFSHPEIFPTVCKMKDQIVPETKNVLPERQTRAAAATNPNNSYSLYHEEYLLQGDLESALKKVTEVISETATKLNTCIQQRLDSFVSNPLCKAVSIFLDTQAYEISDIKDIYTNICVIQDHFKNLLIDNGCETSKIRTEFEILYKHIKMFLGKKSPDKVWPRFHSKKRWVYQI